VSEVASFLASYQRYAPRPLLRVEKDRYLDEVAVVAELLGATGVPHSLTALRAYQRAIEPELVRTAQATEALAFLRAPTSSAPAEVAAHRVIIAAAADLLPEPARSMVAVAEDGTVHRAAVRASAAALAATLRWAIGPSIVREIALDRIAAA
jgi:uncharacterized protein (DUF2236 family)